MKQRTRLTALLLALILLLQCLPSTAFASVPELLASVGDALQRIVIPDSVTSLGSDLFCQSGLVSAAVDSGDPSLPGSLFTYCFSLERVTLADGITNGLSATAFGPTSICNRAQIVTFLYRAIA